MVREPKHNRYHHIGRQQLNNIDWMCDRDALIELYRSTYGTKWSNNTNWNSEERYHLWYGITVDVAGHVLALYLHDNRLDGVIPQGITMKLLVNINNLDLSSNALRGHIPDILGTLKSLQQLNLSWNSLDGKCH